jgi:hypothetical protein
MSRQGEDALWQQVFMAQSARRRVFEPSSKRRKKAPAASDEPHAEIDNQAHPRLPSSSKSRIVMSPSEWLCLSSMISPAAASASATAVPERLNRPGR